MAKVSGNDLVVQALQDEGVDTTFYVTGGPMVDVAVRCVEMFRTVDVRHEQAAAMAAHAYSRVTGKPGVCFAASGPGTTNLITGVGNAFLDAVPVVALGGASAVAQAGMGAFQEMDQVGMFKPITKWAERVIDTRRIPEVINRYLHPKKDRRAYEVWKATRPVRYMSAGETLRVLANTAFVLHWTSDGWATAQDTDSAVNALNIPYADLRDFCPTAGVRIEFTFFWTETQLWEGRNYDITVL